ncbi:MAG: purine-nucleoside phosphorylase [Clostridia bacterium]|nr:purine-nucleoside phosphorylase [Clostridia bacterium]
MADYPTPHINATPDDFADTVLMPGDPLRAKYIAENFLTDARLVNNVRGVQGYTGVYNGQPVSVMASGMGMPSIGIYSYELYHYFDVKRIIRVGSAGAMQPNIAVRDLVFGLGACTDSSFANQFGLSGTFAPVCSYDMLKTAVEIADTTGLKYHVGNLLSSDVFYNDSVNTAEVWGKMGVLAVEMEAAALYMTAARAGREALAICTVSDHLLTGLATTAEERQNSFDEMITLALELAIR